MTDSSSAQWGLTISGFYYIALNRISGELDGLYFDPGSQPYQSLKMVPWNFNHAATQDVRLDKCDENKKVEEVDCAASGSAGSKNGVMRELGLRRYFPAIEFR
jgi:hypothetical protein